MPKYGFSATVGLGGTIWTIACIDGSKWRKTVEKDLFWPFLAVFGHFCPFLAFLPSKFQHAPVANEFIPLETLESVPEKAPAM